MALTSIFWCAVGYFVLVHMAVALAEFSCRSSSICKNESDVCCENANGNQWCCPETKICCNEETGCCLSRNQESQGKQKALFKRKILKQTKKPTLLDKFKRHEIKFLSLTPKYKKCDKEGIFYCPEQETCCESSSGLWKCCQYENGTCCGDKENCCPANRTCDGEGCKKLGPSFENVQAPGEFCPDQKQVCPDTFSCCLNGIETYGCCPYRDAVCCPDLLNCCPPLTECDIVEKKCVPFRHQTGQYTKNIPFTRLRMNK
ncbi:progranulin-like [Uloborus diversus]|uniref:progranulin-like n=1 Tax=Uloborus diversus TaxID=327109 RepID=UPI00240A1E58|nr:progranulin-like [Uloborus diversus]